MDRQIIMQSLVVNGLFSEQFFTWNITLGGLEERGERMMEQSRMKVQIVQKDSEMTQRKNNEKQGGAAFDELETLNVEV